MSENPITLEALADSNSKTSKFMQVVNFTEHKIPRFEIVRGKNWVYYGEDNLYPQYLNMIFTRSAYHNAIVTGKKEYIVGNGFIIDEAETNNKAGVEKLLKQINKGETFNQLLEKIALDLAIFGGYCLQAIYEKGSTKIAELYHIPFQKVRAGKYAGMNFFPSPNYRNDKIFDFYISDDWSQINQSASRTFLRGFNAFDPLNLKEGEKTQLIYFKEYRPDTEVYPIPDYIGAIPYIEMDYEMANFHLNSIKRGFKGSMVIAFNNGVPSREEQQTIDRQISGKFTGTDNANSYILTFSDDKTQAPEISALQPPDVDKQWVAVENTVCQGIFTGHKVTSPMLFGIKTSGQLGGRDELREASELFQNTVINHYQQIICRELNLLLNVGFGISGSPLKIQPTEPLKWELEGRIVATAMTKDEIRMNAGFEPLNIKGVTDTLPPPQVVSEPPLKLGSQKPKAQKEDQDYILTRFRSLGVPISKNNIYKTQKVFFKGDNWVDHGNRLLQLEKQELQLHFGKDENPKDDLSTAGVAILKVLKSKPGANVDHLVTDTGFPKEQVAKELSGLVAEGYITGPRILTGEGDKALKPIPKTSIIELRYQYDVMDGLGDKVIPTTREFCRQMLDMSGSDDVAMTFTRQDIQDVSNEVGYSVWLYRGGFYHNPITDDTTPYCRHDWFQHTIVRSV